MGEQRKRQAGKGGEKQTRGTSSEQPTAEKWPAG